MEPKNAKAHEKVLLKLIHKEEEMQEKLLKLKRKEEEMKEKLELLKAAPKLYVCLWEFVGEEGKGVKVGAGKFFFLFLFYYYYYIICYSYLNFTYFPFLNLSPLR